MEIVTKPTKYELGEMLLEIGSLLMVAGANTERVKVTISRIAGAFECDSQLMITNHALMITLTYNSKVKTFTSVKWVPNMHLNFNLIADISAMSWKIVEEKWSVERINTEMKLLNKKALYPRFLVLFLVALAGSSFCRLMGGETVEMIVCFVGTFLGLYVRQESMKMHFNFYLCVFFAAFTSSFIVGLYSFLNPEAESIHALSTSVLFLIPGVPMINSFSDLIDGNILNGTTRGVNVLVIAFAIALGLMTSLLIFNLH
ncbi:threonine/serine exporter family protein [Flavobacterium cellulosilyticum]|uniref:Threonine/serine exporter n=1 Tax=Flavobacterium cellulosilyticum TaxID=2541731 RepID=A0A4R5CBQ0_9FLAO|nr:threonine/serine exporter family protein [Flavobacterium cellulosilyticum]TDD94554.1 threonine/serine exporter [Flavobacterium cellulosilyticum]